jgi:hypothetical protein
MMTKSICYGSPAQDQYTNGVQFLARFHSVGPQISLGGAPIYISHPQYIPADTLYYVASN